MKRFSLFLALASGAFAQSLSIAASPTVAPSGTPVTLTVSLANGTGPAGLQWDMSGLPTGVTVSSSVVGKLAQCTATRCLLVGSDASNPNANAIPDGPVATIKYTQPPTATTLTLAATLGASPAGASVTIAPPLPLTVSMQSRCDMNGDGLINSADVGLILQQALTATTGTPTILDVVRVIIAANGGVCLR